MTRHLYSLVIAVSCFTNYVALTHSDQDKTVGEIIQLTPIIGFIISPEENRQYNFFPNNEDFVSAEIIKIANQHQLHITTTVDGKRLRQIQKITSEVTQKFKKIKL